VIAGSVVTLNVGKIMDQDTLSGSGQLVGDPWWTYTVSDAGGGTVLEEVPGSQNDLVAALIVTWQAPDVDGTVSLEVTATDVVTPPEVQWPPNAIDSPVTFAAYTVHVHQLEVSKLYQWGGLFVGAVDPRAPLTIPHCIYFSPPLSPEELAQQQWEAVPCDGWARTTQLIPNLRWDRDNAAYEHQHMRFDGGVGASISLKLRGRGGWTGAVVPTTIRVHTDWPEEGTSLQGSELEVAGLETISIVVQTPEGHSLDDVVTLARGHCWSWECDVACETEYQQTLTLPDNPSLDWVATGHGVIVDPDEATPKRVEAVYDALNGLHWTTDIAEGVGAWLRSEVQFEASAGWVVPYGVSEVWCILCRGWADCLRGDQVCAEACKLVGVQAYAGAAFPQSVWDPCVPPGWIDVVTCWSGLGLHYGNPVGFKAGNGYNAFEGFYALGEPPPPGQMAQVPGLYYTWENQPPGPFGYHWSNLAQTVTCISYCYACAAPGGPNEPPVWTDHNEQTHYIPEPLIP